MSSTNFEAEENDFATAGLMHDTSGSISPSYYKTVLEEADVHVSTKKLINSDNTVTPSNECDCTSANYNIASNSRGCLKCTTEDCSYYIQNVVETFLFDYNIPIYQCEKK
jgi:hypothetical protein